MIVLPHERVLKPSIGGVFAMTPLEKVELLYDELVAHYESGEDREIRAASKLLLVALDKFREHGGNGWTALLDEYIVMVKENPDKFVKILKSQRGSDGKTFFA
jgi:hypothetical protein